MPTKTIGIIVNGATGRIGSTQHLAKALVPIRREGGLAVGGDRIVPRLLLVGRDAGRLAQIAATHGVTEWSTDLDAALGDSSCGVFFDAAATHQRRQTLDKAIAAGKHLYTEKPVALSAADGLALLGAARARGLKHGAVEDKQYLPGLQKLAAPSRAGLFGRLVGFRLEFRWWVVDRVERAAPPPSWEYSRAGEGAGAGRARGLKQGAVEDRQYPPGLQKLAALSRAGFLGRVVGFRLEFGWWVFDGVERPSQRPSWNYPRAAEEAGARKRRELLQARQ